MKTIYKIVAIHEEDAYFEDSKKLIGKIGSPEYGVSKTGWYEVPFKLNRSVDVDKEKTYYLHFFKVKLQKV